MLSFPAFAIPKNRIIRAVALFIAALTVFRFFVVPLRRPEDTARPFMVRVRIAHNVQSLKMWSAAGCKVTDLVAGEVLSEKGTMRKSMKITPAGTGIKVGKTVYDTGRICVTPYGGKPVVLNGVRYRGEMDVIRTDKGLDAVNRIALEDYLKGVLPKEVHPFWPFSALEAQAIASRSYAVHRAERSRNKDYDLTADTYSQVYGGKSCEKWRTSKAVEGTKGKILEYGGKVLPGYFHSCCGGRTQDGSRMWGGPSTPLKSVRCSWCRWSPHFRWQAKVSTKKIMLELRKKGYDVDRIDNIKAGKQDKSGRLKYVRVRTRNRWMEVTAADLRSAVGRRLIKSRNFRIKKYPTFYLFSGYGWGHGVGMCQWGAFGQSLRRRSAERILGYYYPGADIVDLGSAKKEQKNNIETGQT